MWRSRVKESRNKKQTHKAIIAITTDTSVISFTILQIDKIRIIKGAKETTPS